MYTQTVNYIASFFENLDNALGLSVPFQYCVKDKGKFPLYRGDIGLVIVPAFFNHPDLNNDIRSVLLAELYSCFYLDKNKNSEIERHPKYEPLVLVIDVRGRRNIIKRYPLAKSLFISPPSYEVLKTRIVDRNENTSGEIEHRLTIAKEELEQAGMYDHIVVNNDINTCIEDIFRILSNTRL